MKKAKDILEKVFANHPRNFNVRLWNGQLINWSDAPAFILEFKTKSCFKKLFLRGNEFTAGAAYVEGELEIEGDILQAVETGAYLTSLKLNRREKLKLLAKLVTL